MSSKILEAALGIFFPPLCVRCGAEGEYICASCEVFCSEASYICPVCRASSFTGERHRSCVSRRGLDGLVNAWEYDGVIKRAIHLVKYGGLTHMASELALRALRAYAAIPARSGAFLSYLYGEDVVISFSPMWRAKEKIRGFNQAEVLARGIARAAGKRPLPLLVKIRDTRSQVDLEQKERFFNVRNSIAVREGSNVRGRRILVVDDVWTTGSTMQECCRALKRAGARTVWGCTLARTP